MQTVTRLCGGVFLKNILIVFGGKSCEHDISVITGVLTTNSIDGNLYNKIPVYVTSDGEWYYSPILNDLEWYKNKDYKKLNKVTLVLGDNSLYSINKGRLKKLFKIDCAINCMHGVNGEDGSLCGIMALSEIPLASPDTFTSSFSIDKDVTKIVLKGLNVNCLPYLRIMKDCFFTKKDLAIKMIESKFTYPVIVKPSHLGSSIGISVAKDKVELEQALITAFSYDDKVIVERALKNFTEINQSVYKIGEEIHLSPLEKPFMEKDILSFKDKYLPNNKLPKKEFPAKIKDKLKNEIYKITEKVYRKCCFNGIIRIDYLIENDVVYLNEINTVPGSLAYYLHCQNIKEFSYLLTSLIESTIHSFNQKKSLKKVYLSGVLNVKGAKGKR